MSLLSLSTPSYERSWRYLRHGPGHFLMYVFGRFRAVRLLMVWIYSQRPPKALPASATALVQDVDVDQAVSNIRRNGFFFGLYLREEVLQDLLAYSWTAICFGDGISAFPFRYAEKDVAQEQFGRTFRLGRYNQALLTSPVLQALASDATLIAIARQYLRAEPVLIGVRMWWSFAGPADTEQKMGAGQGFHYDIDGYAGLTFFFYLTAVSPSNGPHLYIRGTHARKSLRHIVTFHRGRSDAEVERCYGPERQVISCGPAGSGFAEDVFGFHKGLPPESGDRLIVQVRYGIHDYGTGRED